MPEMHSWLCLFLRICRGTQAKWDALPDAQHSFFNPGQRFHISQGQATHDTNTAPFLVFVVTQPFLALPA